MPRGNTWSPSSTRGTDDRTIKDGAVASIVSAAASCLPGVRPQVVVSAGTLRLLDDVQLAAVLSHERAHALPVVRRPPGLPSPTGGSLAGDRAELTTQVLERQR